MSKSVKQTEPGAPYLVRRARPDASDFLLRFRRLHHCLPLRRAVIRCRFRQRLR
jgi:hypothetical protein